MKRLRLLFCALFGHSKIVEGCMGFIHCSRCGQLLGDTLAGCYDLSKCFVIGHLDCDCACRSNLKKMSWKHKLLVRVK